MTGINQAYLQSSEKLQQDIFIEPCVEFGQDSSKLLKLEKPLYGLSESDYYWDRTLRTHAPKKLYIKSCISDPAVFFKFKYEGLTGICATYVDGTLHAGNQKYLNDSKLTEKTFNVNL